jgi:hypothetical protein
LINNTGSHFVLVLLVLVLVLVVVVVVVVVLVHAARRLVALLLRLQWIWGGSVAACLTVCVGLLLCVRVSACAQVFGTAVKLQAVQGVRQFLRVRFEDLALRPFAELQVKTRSACHNLCWPWLAGLASKKRRARSS